MMAMLEDFKFVAKPNLCFIFGTGASTRFFSGMHEFFRYRGAVIGLNQAWKVINPHLTLTIHAHEPGILPSQNIEGSFLQAGRIITKAKGPADHWSHTIGKDPYNRRAFIFEGNSDPHDFTFCENRIPNKLYLGRGIQATAITLAAHLGFKTVVLIGCDMCDLDGDHHGIKNHHVRMHGLQPEDVYREYYECTARVREIVHRKFGTRVYSLSPFLGLGREQEDYRLLKSQLGLAEIGTQQDTSKYERTVDRFL